MPIRLVPHVDIVGDAVAVDDHLAEAVAVIEEFVADPAKVAARLLLDARPRAARRHGRTDSRRSRSSFRSRRGNRHARPARCARAARPARHNRRSRYCSGADSVAEQRLAPADPGQEAQRARSPRGRAHEHLLVIAHQEADRPRPATELQQPLDDAARIRAAIDQVAEEDDLVSAGPRSPHRPSSISASSRSSRSSRP